MSFPRAVDDLLADLMRRVAIVHLLRPSLGGFSAGVEAGQRTPELFPLFDDGFGLAGAVEDVELSSHHADDRLARGAEVVARIELLGLGREDFADLRGHR